MTLSENSFQSIVSEYPAECLRQFNNRDRALVDATNRIEGISYRRGTGGGYQFFGIGWYKGGNRQSHDFHGEPIDDSDTPF